MAATLHFTLPQDRLHPAFNALDQQLNSLQTGASPGFKLKVVNALWGQQDWIFLPSFLDTLSLNYGAGMRLLDFKTAPEPSRLAINAWVSDQTQQKIQDLLPAGAIGQGTGLVLTNAVYFQANWAFPFEYYHDRAFLLSVGTQVEVPTMRLLEELGYAHTNGVQMVELPYTDSSFSMIILLPDTQAMDSLEALLAEGNLPTMLSQMTTAHFIDFNLPKFSFDTSISLGSVLSGMGMLDAFDDNTADFSGMDGAKDLMLGDVLHKAYISVGMVGTVAAGASGVVVTQIVDQRIAKDSITVNVDHPFLFLIMDRSSGSLLFIGRVVEPG